MESSRPLFLNICRHFVWHRFALSPHFSSSSLLRVKREEIPLLLTYGVIGFACVNLGYFLGIERGLPLGLVLILEFTAPIWVVLWIKYFRKGFVARQMWLAIAMALGGLVLVAKVWDGFAFDFIGTMGALGSAIALTVYFLLGEKVTANRPPLGATIIGLGIAGAFWLVVLPIWDFPTEIFSMQMDVHGYLAGHDFPGWLLLLWVVVMGTIVPYFFVLSGLSMLSASKSSVIGMVEPVLAAMFAWIWLGQSWDAIQLVGAVIVLIGIYLADRSKTTAV
jgi:drug/metabolite transporter (DMT)-like permease